MIGTQEGTIILTTTHVSMTSRHLQRTSVSAEGFDELHGNLQQDSWPLVGLDFMPD